MGRLINGFPHRACARTQPWVLGPQRPTRIEGCSRATRLDSNGEPPAEPAKANTNSTSKEGTKPKTNYDPSRGLTAEAS
jgi:hypothetical protein